MFESKTHTNTNAKGGNANGRALFFQPKLTINQPNDIYEQEADAMADKVMRMKDTNASQSFFAPAIFSHSFGGGHGEAVQRKCAACEEEEKIQRKNAAPDIQKQDEDEQKGTEFKPFPPGVTGRWPGFGFNLDVTNTQFDFGDPAHRQLSLGLNYPGEPYAALTAGKFAFKLGYDFAENNLFAGGRYGGLSYGLMAGFDNPSFGLGLGYGHFPLFNYNMRSAFQFGNTPLPYDFMYRNELDRTQAAIGNWQQGGATDPDRFFTVVGEAGNFASMTGDIFDVGNKPKYDWGAGINIGYDPQMQWYFMAGVQFYLGKKDQNKTTLVDRKCASCEQENVLHRKKSSSGEINDSNNFENYVSNLNSSGSPLSSSSKQFFESRFGADFSDVKIHNDVVAAKSASSINALAYTSGNNIVFNVGQYAPGTEGGDKLLAHELTHVVQQGATVQVSKYSGSDNDASAQKSSMEKNGYAEINNSVASNSLFAGNGQQGISPLFIQRDSKTRRDFDEPSGGTPAPATPGPAKPHTPVCGPDISAQVRNAIALLKAYWISWNSDERDEACWALENISCGPEAWDIVKLHNRKWIDLDYTPACAGVNSNPGCASTVSVDGDCHFAGSVNYVIFGHMCRLCDMWESTMAALIWLYKHSSGNYDGSRNWALAGFADWPSSANPPSDRSNCSPACPVLYGPTANNSAGIFDFHWYPSHATESISSSCSSALKSYRLMKNTEYLPGDFGL